MNGRQLARTTTAQGGFPGLRAGLKGAAVVAAGLLALTACGGGDGGSDASAKGEKSGDKAAAATRTVKHDAGTAEKVPAQPKRIVSVSVTMTGHLLALDAPVIASQATPPSVITDKQGFFTQWSDAAAQNSVKVAYQGFEPDVEKVLALKPDLIVGASSGAENAEKFYDKLSVVAPTLLYRHDDVSWQDLTARLGKDLGLEKRATEVVAAHDKRVGEVKAAITVPKESAALVRDNQSAMTVFTPSRPRAGCSPRSASRCWSRPRARARRRAAVRTSRSSARRRWPTPRRTARSSSSATPPRRSPQPPCARSGRTCPPSRTSGSTTSAWTPSGWTTTARAT